MKYWTKTPGTGGKVLSEDDFVVSELPAKKFLTKYERKNGRVSPVSGPFFLYRLKKRGMTTKAAVDFVRHKFDLNEIGFAGLKDKHAVTSQYITTRRQVEGFESDRLTLEFVSPCKNMMQVGELEGNSFCITLHGCRRPENAKKIIKELEKGMPNYFGPQRFGLHGNHDIGRLILKKDYNSALNKIGVDIQSVDKKMIKFYLHAYQSFAFNSVLDRYIKKYSKPIFNDIPLVGFDTKLKNDFFGKETNRILKADGISVKNFQIRDLAITCRGSQRAPFIMVKNISYEIKEDGRSVVVLNFELPKGSYATVVIREITK